MSSFLVNKDKPMSMALYKLCKKGRWVETASNIFKLSYFSCKLVHFFYFLFFPFLSGNHKKRFRKCLHVVVFFFQEFKNKIQT
ncbi:unnamed protein product [Coffea canephora]|uniref:DH200=94 genomic scaffold, scaffold_1327 n=1 Tax=Coffea canephora TaxID=49390 RepID=A0A068VI73_COFCA|nr:unnamed protein product [Coffea canephora]